MKSILFAKYVAVRASFAIRIYYIIVILVLGFLAAMNTQGNTTSSGLEFSSVIFIFILGLNMFTENFRFGLTNHLSRIQIQKGLVCGMYFIAMFLSFMDLLLNRLYNLFVPSPTNYDMIYTSLRETGMFDWDSATIIWTQSNDFIHLLSTWLFQFAVYSAVGLLGLMIVLIYYRSRRWLKFVVSAIPIAAVVLARYWIDMVPGVVFTWIDSALGWENQNAWIASLTFILSSLLFAFFAYMLSRRAEIIKAS